MPWYSLQMGWGHSSCIHQQVKILQTHPYINYIHNYTDSEFPTGEWHDVPNSFRLLASCHTLTPVPIWDMISVSTFTERCMLGFATFNLNKNTMVCPWQSTYPAFDNGTLGGKNEGERWVIAGDFSSSYVHKLLLNGLLSSGEVNMSNLCYEFQCICSAPLMFAILNLSNLFL